MRALAASRAPLPTSLGRTPAAPSLIKIDVEGVEDGVFLGAERTLREARPAVIAEVRGGTIWEAVSR